MAVLVVSDNYYYIKGLEHIADDCHCIYAPAKRIGSQARARCEELEKDDFIVIQFSSLKGIEDFHQFCQYHCQATVIIDADIKMTSVICKVDNVFFMSSTTGVRTIDAVFKHKLSFFRKCALTEAERITMTLMLDGIGMTDISKILGTSIKTVSFRKNKVIEKIGLINKNNFMFFGLMKFVLKSV